jgi:uncharacterized membrane protein (UPF0127 family)
VSTGLHRFATAFAFVLLTACAQPAQKAPSAPPPETPAAAAPTPTVHPTQIPANAPPEPAAGPREPLTIVTDHGPVVFQVEIADTEPKREQGLMFRRSIAPDHGMLFDFIRAKEAYFWMRNTYIPLDMLFIAEDGRIVAIAANTRPLDESPVGPGTPVRAVLEIGAGRADVLGIRPGDKVSHRIFPAG